jgi:hypothetical protein
MADAPPEPAAPEATPDDPSSAVLAAVANLSLKSARVTLGDLAADMPDLDPDAIHDALAALADAGWLTEWEVPGGAPDVCLSALGGRRLGLKLTHGRMEDLIGRWAPPCKTRDKGVVQLRGDRVRTITEADLVKADETPLAQMTSDRLRVRVARRDLGPGTDWAEMEATDAEVRRLRAMRAAGAGESEMIVTSGLAAEYARFLQWLDAAWSAETVIVLMGGMPWPLPGQDRRDGPSAADCTPPPPSEGDSPSGEKARRPDRPMVAGKLGPCPVCKGRKLARNEFCASPGCERGGFDGRIPTSIREAVQASKRPKPVVVAPKAGKGKDRAGGRGKRFAGSAERGGLKGGLGA